MRRHPDQRDALLAAFGMLDRIVVAIVLVDPALPNDPASPPMTPAIWLARSTRSELVTLDRRLAAAGRTPL